MLREEAIEILQGAIKKPNTKDGYLGQAINMAIKALEQEPCEDCVKIEKAYELGYEDCRADVLEIIGKYRSKSEE